MNPGGRAALQKELTAPARGDRAAFDPLFRRLWPLLRGFAQRCLPAGEAEDAAQEALLRIFSRASEFDPERDALAWVLGVAAWQVRTHRTKARRRREEAADALPEREAARPSPEMEAMARDLGAARRVGGRSVEARWLPSDLPPLSAAFRRACWVSPASSSASSPAAPRCSSRADPSASDTPVRSVRSLRPEGGRSLTLRERERVRVQASGRGRIRPSRSPVRPRAQNPNERARRYRVT